LSRRAAKFVVVDRVLDSIFDITARCAVSMMPLSLLSVCSHFTRLDYIRTLGAAVVVAAGSGPKYILPRTLQRRARRCGGHCTYVLRINNTAGQHTREARYHLSFVLGLTQRVFYYGIRDMWSLVQASPTHIFATHNSCL
jgi:hypothetical protein